MKFFACVCLIGLLAGAVAGSDAEMDHYEEAQDAVEMEEDADPARFGRAAYAAPSYASPSYSAPSKAVYPGPAQTYSYGSPAPKVPCGKHLLFSCQPSVAPVPCVAPKYSAPSYSGAYSEPAPVYMYPNTAY